VNDGTHTLTVQTEDGSCLGAMSAPLSFSVSNAPPTVSITSPSAGAVLARQVILDASATPNPATQAPISQVVFYVDGHQVGVDTIAPYEVPWKTTSATNGLHTLTARAVDSNQRIGASSNVQVTVKNDPVEWDNVGAAPHSGPPGTIFQVTGTLLDATDGSPLSNVAVELLGAPEGHALQPLAQGSTDASGSVTFPVRPGLNTAYALAFAGGGNYESGQSQDTVVQITPQVTLSSGYTTASKPRTAIFTTHTRPHVAGIPLLVQLFSNGHWRTLGAIKSRASGNEQFSVTFQRRGKNVIRLFHKADQQYAATKSNSSTVTIR